MSIRKINLKVTWEYRKELKAFQKSKKKKKKRVKIASKKIRKGNIEPNGQKQNISFSPKEISISPEYSFERPCNQHNDWRFSFRFTI